ncbi:hypothetical protein EVAR_82333_1 [Eumeta japonica]|uniref:Uncharacterized protein n=1 Tax=Eumeta variegata TaxID=151549 RepID=A0A4C1UAQ3_EUMVA|nr:hypothetical protein EVAR_82333_1 [Eumeta japonica]
MRGPRRWCMMVGSRRLGKLFISPWAPLSWEGTRGSAKAGSRLDAESVHRLHREALTAEISFNILNGKIGGNAFDNGFDFTLLL